MYLIEYVVLNFQILHMYNECFLNHYAISYFDQKRHGFHGGFLQGHIIA